MQHLEIFPGGQQKATLTAITAHITDAPIADLTTPAVLAATGPILSNILTDKSSGETSIILAPGLYVVCGRLVDTRTWPDTARKLTLKGIDTALLPARIMLSVTWQWRSWSIDAPFNVGEAPLNQSSQQDVPADKCAYKSTEPVLHVTYSNTNAQPDALCLGQITRKPNGELCINEFFLPNVADISRAPAIKQAVLKWLQPVFERVDDLEQTHLSADRALSGAVDFQATQVSLWAESTRQSMGMVGAVNMPTAMDAFRASMDRIATKIGANPLPPVKANDNGFDLEDWLPDDFRRSLCQAIDAVAAKLARPTASFVLNRAETKASYTDGIITVHTKLKKTLDKVLGLKKGHASAIKILVEPTQRDVILDPTGTGTALLHPNKQANRLPDALGRIPLTTTAHGLSMHVPLTITGFYDKFSDEIIDEVILADEFRLVISAEILASSDADGDVDVDHGALPLAVTLVKH